MVSFKSLTVTAIVVLTLASCGSKSSGDGAVRPHNKQENESPQTSSPREPGMRTISTAAGMQMQISAERAESIKPKLAYVFQGKGTALTWDIGAIKGAHERIPLLNTESNPQALAAGDIVVTGNSSGSVLAAWFSCRGFTHESINGAIDLMSQLPTNLVNEATTGKFLEVFGAMTQGREFGSPIETIVPMVDNVVAKGSCVPKLPTLIVASNLDVNDRRRWLNSSNKQSRVFDIRDYSYWEQSAMTNYQPLKVGKICTYFADPVMFRYLTESMRADERLCDVRLMENADDMKLAVLASIAEPTYFVPVPDPNPAKLVRYTAPSQTQSARSYNGGFSMPGPIQDVKRLFPEVRALGSGRWEYDTIEVMILKRWYGLNLNESQDNARWWFDLETFPSSAEKDALLARPKEISGQALVDRYRYEINLGYQRSISCLHKGSNCITPTKTIGAQDPNRPYFTRPVGQPNAPEISTKQGIDILLY